MSLSIAEIAYELNDIFLEIFQKVVFVICRINSEDKRAFRRS